MSGMHYFTIEQRNELHALLQDRAGSLRSGTKADELRAVEDALARLHTPEFGLCVDCGAELAFARLRSDPLATRCKACEARNS